MNKAQLVNLIARDLGLTKRDVGRVLESMVAHVTRTLKRGDRVTFVGFGTFTVTRHKSRRGYNPHTGTSLRIPGRRVPRFSPGKELKSAVR